MKRSNFFYDFEHSNYISSLSVHTNFLARHFLLFFLLLKRNIFLFPEFSDDRRVQECGNWVEKQLLSPINNEVV